MLDMPGSLGALVAFLMIPIPAHLPSGGMSNGWAPNPVAEICIFIADDRRLGLACVPLRPPLQTEVTSSTDIRKG
jgi:hypothetical protein